MTTVHLRATEPTEARTTRRESWGDALKGALIVLVVLWHVIVKTYLQVDWQIALPMPRAWALLAEVIWPFLLPLFLLVSGYFAAPALTRPWSQVIRPRIVRFLYLYLLWSLIHMAALWAFPDFPTLVPRSVSQFVEFVTISPPDTWYLYALALYFLVAKALSRVAPWLVLSAAVALSIAVSAGYIESVSNRGSLLYNFAFFLLGAHLAPQLRRVIASITLPVTAMLVVGYLAAFAVVRLTGTEAVPGVWPLLSLIGCAMGLAVAATIWRLRLVDSGLGWLGRRSLPIYLIHMPLLALADLVLVGWLSGASGAVQFVAAVTAPVILTTVLVAASLALNALLVRDGASWLFDLPRWPTRALSSAGSVIRRAPWRAGVAVLLLVVCGVVATRAAAIPGCGADSPGRAAAVAGQVSIGATGDLLIHDIGHRVPADGGAGYFSAVRPWFSQDLVTGNLEQVISDDTGFDKCGTRKNCLEFRSAPSTARYFGGFDILNMANNHTSDFGAVGYANTRANLAANDIRAEGNQNEIVCTRVGDSTVAMIGFAPYRGTNRVTDLRHVRDLVHAAAASADIVIVQAHMGAEGPKANVVRPGTEWMFGENRGDPEAFAHAAIDAGADLVLGHGPHSLRGMEFYHQRLIAYSLGNFGGGGVFGADPATRYGVYLDATLRSDGSFLRAKLRSVHFDDGEGAPTPDPDNRAAQLVGEFSQRDFPRTSPMIESDGTVVPAR